MKTLLSRKSSKSLKTSTTRKLDSRTVFNRATASVLYASILITTNPANAGFLDDFYNQSGATVNITPAGIYQGQSSNVIAGGALTMRVPNRTFNPLTFSPPNFSAGCGGTS